MTSPQAHRGGLRGASGALRLTASALIVWPFLFTPAHAGLQMAQEPLVSSSEPVLLAADQVDYDQPNDVVMASGHVEITQGATVLLADSLIYDRARNQVQATGHVSMLTPTGDVFFADAVELQDDLKVGAVHQLKLRLVDNSVAVAGEARRVDENITELFKAAYTPCNCTDDNGDPKTPLWSLKAERAVIDQKEQEMRYDDATFNVSGVPLIYTPYFAHSTPGADNSSGLLVPELQQSRNLGTVYRQPVYWAIAPDRDATITPIYATKAGGVLAGEYRQMFDDGQLNLDGSVTNAPNRDAQGNQAAGREVRGHFNAAGAFRFDERSNWGFDLHRASDDTYKHLYNFGNETLLTSRLYAERFNLVEGNDRSYAAAQALSFQGLTGQDDSKIIPVVAPLVDVTWQDEPGWYNSRFSLTGNTMALFRQNGAQSRRLSGTVGWKLPYVTADGQVLELGTQLRTDIYDVANVPQPNGRQYNGITGREVPQASATWRYPFINRGEGGSLLIEPIVNLTVSPGGGNPSKIPNEDSLLPEFTDANLFSSERFAGLDRVETGPRMSYGMRGQAQVLTDKYIDWLIGQQYRVVDDPNFPISNDPTSRFSDYVGRVGMSWQPFSLAYRFRLDKDHLAANRSEVDVGYNAYPLALSASYLSLNNDPVLANKEVITGNASLNLTRQWSWNVSGSRDLQQDQTVTAYTGIGFKNECVNLSTMVGKDYTSLLDIKPSLAVWFRASFKNLD